MKVLVFATLALVLTGSSCDAAPQQNTRRQAASSVRVIPPDSPGITKMPVVRTDTARQADMPVVKPPQDVQPK